jgi:isopentenyl-diphosphate delta-isomerase
VVRSSRPRRSRVPCAVGGGGVRLSEAEEIARRKGEHLKLAAEADVETRTPAGWEDIQIVHDALPEVDAAEVDLHVMLLGRRLSLPLVISGMTGGHGRALAVNELLARVAEARGIAMGVGSQRAALRDPMLVPTYSVVRQSAPTAFIIANVGISQLVKQDREPALGTRDLAQVVAMVKANALAVHLNYLEESVQPEGQTRARGALAAIRAVAKRAKVPVIAKETGAGITRDVALRLRRAGVRAIDVGGVGGTSFAAVEAMRAAAQSDHARMNLGERFRDWGVPTSVAVAGASTVGLPVIATGGVRSGLDAAKALALGATCVGVGRPLLQAALRGESEVNRWIDAFELELRTAVFLSGVRRATDLRRAQVVVTGASRQWLDQLGYRRASAATARRRH